MRAIFDSHLHIIDPAFPLVANHGFLPAPYSVGAYQHELSGLRVGAVGGVIVSGSFQATDTAYIAPALAALGPTWRAVVNLSTGIDDAEVLRLHALGVRALRVNLRRGLLRRHGRNLSRGGDRDWR